MEDGPEAGRLEGAAPRGSGRVAAGPRRIPLRPGLMTGVGLLLFLLILFCVYPVLRVVATALFLDGRPDWLLVKNALVNPSYRLVLANSVRLGATVAFCATCLGFLFAFALVRTAVPFRRFFHVVALLPVLSPPFVISLAVIILFGRNGIISHGLFGIRNSNVYGFASLAVVQVLALFPLAYLNLRGVLETMDRTAEDASRSLGASRLRAFLDVTLPLCVPGILSSLLLVFAKSISDFGNPQILAGEYSVLSVQAYLYVNGLYDLRSGAFLALSILLPTILAFLLQRYWTARRDYAALSGGVYRGSGRITRKRVVAPLTAACLIVALAVVLFYGTVVWISFVRLWGVDMDFSMHNFQFVFRYGWRAIVDTLVLSCAATPVTAALGMAVAFLLVRRAFPGKALVGAAVFVPFAVPGMVLGIGYVLAFNGPPLPLTGTAAIIVLALVFRNLAVGVETGIASLRQIDPVLDDAARSLGASGFTAFRTVSLPLIRPALYAALVNAFVRSMTSFSAVIFLVSVNWRLLTVSILSEIESGRLGAASAYCVILMAAVLASFGALELLLGRMSVRRDFA